MPASFAEGGFKLCDAGLAAFATGNVHSHAHDHGNAAEQPAPHAHDDEQGSHHEWEQSDRSDDLEYPGGTLTPTRYLRPALLR